MTIAADAPWWATAVFYQVYPRSFADGNDDGAGDLIGLREKLPYLKQLGIDALWLSPFYVSPLADGGYDVADPCDVDPMFGTLADFDAMLTDAHALGIKVTVDIVPNHFSDQHPWFQAALAALPGSPERSRFIFRDGKGVNGDEPPNNWPAIFGGPAWHRVPSTGPSGGIPGNEGVAAGGDQGQWYLHIFAPEQPDLDWTNPEVPAEFGRILRFWLDRGVDGFRIDVTHGIAKPAGLPDMDPALVEQLNRHEHDSHMAAGKDLRFDNDGVHEYHRMFRRILDSYPGDRMAVGEAWIPDPKRLAMYVRPDELNLTFNFELVDAKWDAGSYKEAINDSMAALAEVGAPCTWVLANHDVDRTVTRYGGGEAGLARARAAALVTLSLPGAVYVYNGDELGLSNVELPDEALQDPTWARSGHTDRGRDGERVPMPWSGDKPPYGFGTDAAATWLPQPDDWASFTAEAEDRSPESTLNLYRRALALRASLPELLGGGFEWGDSAVGVLVYRRDGVTVVMNASPVATPLPAGELLICSTPLVGGELPTDAVAWVRPA
ncbi:MAG TPA: alpha-amylase family glycosyl hydrolase [Jatrophihabitans sp.]